MTLTADDVIQAYTALTSRRPDAAEAERAATLFGSREELLAWLIVRESALKDVPGLRSALAEVAEHYTVRAATPRLERSNAAHQMVAGEELSRALDQLLADEIARKPLGDRIDGAFGAVRRGRSDGPAPAGYRLSIKPPVQG